MSADSERVFTCPDGRALHGTVFDVPRGVERRGTVVIACATAVKATYYHRYAAFLAANGFAAVTFDYRGLASPAAGPCVDKGFAGTSGAPKISTPCWRGPWNTRAGCL
ncbi:hypothetical protein NHF46_02155 [Arthrobacter alpinus]|nr:hypothetical protein [Arthrobacter alpinus]